VIFYYFYNNKSIEGIADVNITSYHGENLINYETSGSAFVISEYVKLTLKYVNYI